MLTGTQFGKKYPPPSVLDNSCLKTRGFEVIEGREKEQGSEPDLGASAGALSQILTKCGSE
jgi:hypothetical protein